MSWPLNLQLTRFYDVLLTADVWGSDAGKHTGLECLDTLRMSHLGLRESHNCVKKLHRKKDLFGRIEQKTFLPITIDKTDILDFLNIYGEIIFLLDLSLFPSVYLGRPNDGRKSPRWSFLMVWFVSGRKSWPSTNSLLAKISNLDSDLRSQLSVWVLGYLHSNEFHFFVCCQISLNSCVSNPISYCSTSPTSRIIWGHIWPCRDRGSVAIMHV